MNCLPSARALIGLIGVASLGCIQSQRSYVAGDRVGERGLSELRALIDDVDAHLDIVSADEPGLADEVERLIAEREAARAARDFDRADAIREELRRRGIALEDSKEGVRWKRVPAAAR